MLADPPDRFSNLVKVKQCIFNATAGDEFKGVLAGSATHLTLVKTDTSFNF